VNAHKRIAASLRGDRNRDTGISTQASVTASYLPRLVAPGIDMVERLASVLGTTSTDLLPTSAPPDPLPVLKDQAKRMLDTLLAHGNRDIFLRLNPFLALLVEVATKRGTG
jgi:hypothetical protein